MPRKTIADQLLASMCWVWRRWRWFVGLGAVLLLVAGPTFPGRANNDTIAMVREMDAGSYSDWWSPILMMIWRPFYEIGFGIGFIQLGTIITMFVALGALVRPLFFRQWSAIAASVALCLFPTTYSMLLNVIRDTWFTAAVVASLAVIFRTRSPSPIHGSLLLVGFLAIVAARQNGVIVVIVLAFAAAAHWRILRIDRSAAARLTLWAGLSVAVGATYLAGAQLVARAADVMPTGPETATFYVDLDDMSTRVGEVLVPDAFVRQQLTLEDLAEQRNYTADNIKDRVLLRLPAEDRPAAADAWREAIVEHPKVYLQSRWQMFTRQIGWSGPPLESHYPTDVSAHVFPPQSPRLSAVATNYLEMFDGGDWQRGGFLHRPWIYIIIAAAAALRFARRWPLLYTIPSVQLSVFAGLFFLSPVSKTRLVYPTFILGIVAGTYLLFGGRALLVEELRSVRPGPSPRQTEEQPANAQINDQRS
jgi:hypothetical protein